METVEDSGWKLIHGDVFRPPRDSDLFATVVGTGVQVFWTLITVIVLAAAWPAFHQLVCSLPFVSSYVGTSTSEVRIVNTSLSWSVSFSQDSSPR